MGFAELFNRSTRYTATDTDSGLSQTFTIVDNLRPDWNHGEYSGAMGIPGAWRASILLSDLLGVVPWNGYRDRSGRPAERIYPTPPLLEQPSPPDTRMTTFSSLGLDLIWHGNAVAVIAERRDGWPTACLPVPAENVQVKRVDQYDQAPLPEGAIGYQIGGRWFSSDDVIHVKGPCRPGALRGMGVLENHLSKTLALADEQGRQARSLGTSGIPTGVLTVEDTPEEPLEKDEADELKADWVRSQRERTIAVLNGRTKFQALSWDPSKTQLLDARKFTLHELALVFGVPLSTLGAETSSRTYRNEEAEGINLLKFSLGGHLARFEQTLSSHMPRGSWAKANLDAILRSDTLTRYQAHEIGLRAGFLTDDEARQLEDRPPLTTAQRAAMRPPAPAPAVTTDAEEGES